VVEPFLLGGYELFLLDDKTIMPLAVLNANGIKKEEKKCTP